MKKEILEQYVRDGWLIKQKHPTLPLSIYNYSQATQYAKHWDEVTLACRGLITDDETEKVIIKPFPKFFNYEEVPDLVPWTTSSHVHIQNKADGSLGILFNYYGEWILATRGSFASEQAIRGMQILQSKYNLKKFSKEFAYLVEIIYPSNRIVVSYEKEMIIFLSVVTSGLYMDESSELNWTTAKSVLSSNNVSIDDIVKTKFIVGDSITSDIYNTLKGQNKPNEEGYVIRFFPSNFRCKIKFEEYIRLHRILTQTSSYDVWEAIMKFGKLTEEVLENVPDEFFEWVKITEKSILDKCREVEKEYLELYTKFADIELQKDFALQVTAYCKEHRKMSSIFFMLRQGRTIFEHTDSPNNIWRIVKPDYSKPFCTIDE